MKYAKAIAAIVGAVVVAFQTAVLDDTFAGDDWTTVAIAALTAVGVYLVKNDPVE